MKYHENLDGIMRLGLSEGETRVYCALLTRKDSTAMEIHEIAKVPRSKVYEITQKLVARGMCIEKMMGRKKTYQAIEPSRAFKNLIEERENELEDMKELATEISKLVDPVYNRGMQNVGMSDYVEILKDLSSIHERYVSLVQNTKKEMLSFVRPPFSYQGNRRKFREQENTEFEILKRNVSVRALYEFPAPREVDSTLVHIKRCVSAGEKARVIKNLPIKMYVFDVRHVLMALDNTKQSASPLTMIIIEHPGLAMAAKILFNLLWEKAEDYRDLKALMESESKGISKEQ